MFNEQIMDFGVAVFDSFDPVEVSDDGQARMLSIIDYYLNSDVNEFSKFPVCQGVARIKQSLYEPNPGIWEEYSTGNIVFGDYVDRRKVEAAGEFTIFGSSQRFDFLIVAEYTWSTNAQLHRVPVLTSCTRQIKLRQQPTPLPDMSQYMKALRVHRPPVNHGELFRGSLGEGESIAMTGFSPSPIMGDADQYAEIIFNVTPFSARSCEFELQLSNGKVISFYINDGIPQKVKITTFADKDAFCRHYNQARLEGKHDAFYGCINVLTVPKENAFFLVDHLPDVEYDGRTKALINTPNDLRWTPPIAYPDMANADSYGGGFISATGNYVRVARETGFYQLVYNAEQEGLAEVSVDIDDYTLESLPFATQSSSFSLPFHVLQGQTIGVSTTLRQGSVCVELYKLSGYYE